MFTVENLPISFNYRIHVLFSILRFHVEDEMAMNHLTNFGEGVFPKRPIFSRSKFEEKKKFNQNSNLITSSERGKNSELNGISFIRKMIVLRNVLRDNF